MNTQYLNVKEAAVYLGTTERFIRRLIAERRIAFHKLGTHVRLALGDLDAYAQAGGVSLCGCQAAVAAGAGSGCR
jgi:excisionase family DNA binding protein